MKIRKEENKVPVWFIPFEKNRSYPVMIVVKIREKYYKTLPDAWIFGKCSNPRCFKPSSFGSRTCGCYRKGEVIKLKHYDSGFRMFSLFWEDGLTSHEKEFIERSLPIYMEVEILGLRQSKNQAKSQKEKSARRLDKILEQGQNLEPEWKTEPEQKTELEEKLEAEWVWLEVHERFPLWIMPLEEGKLYPVLAITKGGNNYYVTTFGMHLYEGKCLNPRCQNSTSSDFECGCSHPEIKMSINLYAPCYPYWKAELTLREKEFVEKNPPYINFRPYKFFHIVYIDRERDKMYASKEEIESVDKSKKSITKQRSSL